MSPLSCSVWPVPRYWTSSLLGHTLGIIWEASALQACISRFLLRSPTPLPDCSLGKEGVSVQPLMSPSVTGENSWTLGCSSRDTGLKETDGELKDTTATETVLKQFRKDFKEMLLNKTVGWTGWKWDKRLENKNSKSFCSITAVASIVFYRNPLKKLDLKTSSTFYP